MLKTTSSFGVKNTALNQTSSIDADSIARSLIPNFGVALFDNPKEMSDGWSCRVDESPKKFNSVAELSNDTIWITSLDWNEFNIRGKKHNHLRRSDYLRSSLIAIAADLGCRIEGSYAMESSVILARAFHQSMLIAIHSYMWEMPATDLCDESLAKDIGRIITMAPKPQQHTRSQLLSAYQSYSMPDWPPNYEPDTINLTMRYNRLEYAQKIMNTMVPDDAWTYAPPEQASRMGIDDFINPERPTLVEAVIELGNIDPDISTLISFGSGSERRAKLRKWISQPELAWISRHAKVRISSALFAQSARPLPKGVMLPDRLVSDPLFSLSLSAGLVAESHWTSVAEPVYNRSSKSNDVSSWAVWLRAVDRSLSFSLALKAYQYGFRVNMYGNGSVGIRVPRTSLPLCLKFADENNISHPAFYQIFKEHGINYD